MPTTSSPLRAWLMALLLWLALVAAPAQAKEVSLKLANLTLLGNLELAEGASPKDGVLLMVHGTLRHNATQTEIDLQRNLKERGVSSLAITLSLGIDRRRGMFDCNQPIRHLHDDAVEEIAAWVEWLKQQDANTIWVLGHSRGGNQVALYLLRRHDPAVKKAVLLAPMSYDPEIAAKKYAKRFGMKLDVALQAAHTLLKGGRGDEPVNWRGLIYCRDATGTARAFLSYHAPRKEFDTPTLLPKLPVPVLVIVPENEEIYPDLPAKMKEVTRTAGREKIRVMVIEGADHFFTEFASEDVADAVVEFLKE